MTLDISKGKIEIVLDATEIDTYQLCPTKYNFRFNYQRVPQALAKPLDSGTLVHKAFEVYYKNLKNKKGFVFSLEKALAAAKIAFQDSDLTSNEAAHILDTIEENLTFWKDEDRAFEIGQVENSFIYPLYEDDKFRISMIGKVDLTVSNHIYTDLPIDHKTFSRDFPVRRLANQFINYANACNSNFVWVNRVGLQKTLKAEDKYKRIPLSYDPDYIEQWKQNMIVWAFKYWDSVETNNWEMNLTSCDKFNRACEYMEVCDTSGNENKVHKLLTDFKQAPKWDVSEGLVEGLVA